MKILLSFLLFLTLFSCKNSKDFKGDFEKQKYDTTVINKLPQYDTIRQIVLANLDSFFTHDNKNDFTYIYNFGTSAQIVGYSNNDIPNVIYPKIDQMFKSVGKENIFGFTVSKDSTVEILIRNKHLSKYFLDVRERLYWFPTKSIIPDAEFPYKDTLLAYNWQYKIWYGKRAEF